MLQVGVALPGALGGMLGVAALLTVIGKAGAQPLVNFYDSYLSWTAGMLPLFYVPTLAVVPSLLQGENWCGVAKMRSLGSAQLCCQAVPNTISVVLLSSLCLRLLVCRLQHYHT
jgi:hypothetical protein